MYAAKLASMFAYSEHAIMNTRLSRQTVRPGTDSATQQQIMARWNRRRNSVTTSRCGTP
jgi:hypothetical protein